MGDPKFKKNMYRRPMKIWDLARLEEESVLMKEYGLRRKKELWRTNGVVSKYTHFAKALIKDYSERAEKEKGFLIQKLQKLNVLGVGAKLDDVLAIKMRNFLERRLQTVVFRMGLGKTMKQARQFILHKHVIIGNNVIISPSYLVNKDEEAILSFRQTSSLIDNEHPERAKMLASKKTATETSAADSTKDKVEVKFQNKYEKKRNERKYHSRQTYNKYKAPDKK